MLRMRSVWLGLLILVVAPWAMAQKSAYETEPTQFGDFKFSSFPEDFNPWKLLRDRQFEALQARLDELMASDARTQEYASHFILSLWKMDDSKLAPQAEEWVAAMPQSYAAQVTLGLLRTTQAWDARGTGWANSVTAEGWIIFKERLGQARQILELAASQRPDRVEAFRLLMPVGMGLDLQAEQCRAWLNQGCKAEPESYGLHNSYLHGIKPRWGGSNQAMQIFVTESIQNGPPRSRLPMLVLDMHEDFAETSGMAADWYRQRPIWMSIEQAYRAMEQNQDGYLSSADRTEFARYAILGGDMALAREQIDKLGVHVVWATEPVYYTRWAGPWPTLGEYFEDRVKVLNASGDTTATLEVERAAFMQALGTALEQNPEHPGLLHNFAYAMLDQGEQGPALDAFERLTRLKPGEPSYYAMIGRLALEPPSDTDRALRALDHYLDIAPETFEVQRDRAIALVRLDRGPEALSTIEKLLTETPDRAQDLWKLVYNYFDSDRQHLGREHLPRMIELIPEGELFGWITVQSYLTLARCQEHAGQFTEGHQSRMTAVERFPKSAMANHGVAQMMILGPDPQLRDYARGIEYGLKAMQLAEHPDFHTAVLVARAYEVNKQPEEAIAMYERAIQTGQERPDYPLHRIDEIRAGRLLETL